MARGTDASDPEAGEPSGARVLELSTVPTLAIDASGLVRLSNPAALRLVARDQSTLIGQPLETIVPARVRTIGGRPIADHLRARSSMGGAPLRMPILRSDGVEIEVDCAVGASADEPDTTVLSLLQRPESVEFAIEAIGAPEGSTEEQQQRYRLVFEHAPVGIFHFDAQAIITACNDLFVELIGSSRSVLVGLDMLTLHDAAMIECVRGALAGRPTHYRGDYHSVTARKVTPVEVDLAPIHGAEGRVIGGVGIVVDVTERKRVQDERALLLLQEREARRSAEDALRLRDDFLAMASHELRTPISSLRLALEHIEEMAERGTLAQAPPASVQKWVGVASRQSAELADFVDELVDVSRAENHLELVPEHTDLADAVRAVVARMGPRLTAAGCSVELDLESAPGAFDRRRIEQVVAILLDNALKFGPRKPVRVVVRADADRARLSVVDQGIGIAPPERERIFERFERAVSTRHYGGLGLGLYVARRIVDAHGGAITVTSEPWQGATFTVELPVSR